MICDRASYNCPLTLSGVEAGTQDPSHHLLSLLPVKATSWRSGHMSGSPFFSLCRTDFKKPSVLFCTFLPSLGLFFSGPGPAPLPPVYTHTPFLSLRSKFVHPPSCGRSSFFFFSFKHLDIDFPNLQDMNLLVCGTAAPGPQDGELMVEEAHRALSVWRDHSLAPEMQGPLHMVVLRVRVVPHRLCLLHPALPSPTLRNARLWF